MSKSLLFFGGLFLLVAAFSAGCSTAPPSDRLEIEGSVTLDGAPLQTGAITFIPLYQGQAVGTTIDAGKYKIDSQEGPIPGEYKVEIDSTHPTGKTTQDSLGNGTDEEYVNLVPAKYNRKSTLTVLFQRDGGDSNFALSSK